MASVVQKAIDPASITSFAAVDPDAVPGEAGFPVPPPTEPVKAWNTLTLNALRPLFAGAPRSLLSVEDNRAIDPTQLGGLRPFTERFALRLNPRTTRSISASRDCRPTSTACAS